MPPVLKKRNGRVQMSMFYTTGEVATLMAACRSTVIRLIDQGEISGFFMPGKRRDRRVTHNSMIMFVRKNPAFRYMLDKLDGYEPSVDFPEGLEPSPALAVPVRSAPPRSAHRPRTVKGGKIPVAPTYSASEVGFVLGLSRRSVISKLDRGILRGFRFPASGLSTFTWRVPIGWLAEFLRENPAYSYARNRIRGCELNGDDREANKKAPADSRAEP
jgi:excisionase family DNA binding protein